MLKALSVPIFRRRNANGSCLAFTSVLLIGIFLSVETTAQPNQNSQGVKRTTDVMYGRKAGMALTMDIFEPATKNGAAVVFLVSGGWLSSHDDTTMVHVAPEYFVPYLSRGYTVFAVVHSSQPYFSIPDIVLDVQRAVRFIRHNAARYGVDRNRFGVLGSSSGGHLALMIAVQGGPGPVHAPDPIDRESSAVQSVACFFPPTDFLNWGAPGVDAVGRGPMSPLVSAFGTISATEPGRQLIGKLISPIYYVTASLPPILIIHGDADTVVPLQQSESFAAKARQVGAPTVKIIIRKGKGHGWADFWKSQEDVEAFADWFDQHLK
ncbi:MAG: alpha/beta hydrolase [Acidobacteriaceae bacterium]|nr:alpha/beta hydrolase [Acidobacteriaceae bacterium]